MCTAEFQISTAGATTCPRAPSPRRSASTTVREAVASACYWVRRPVSAPRTRAHLPLPLRSQVLEEDKAEDRALSMQSPAPPKPWERSGCPVAPGVAASTPGSTAVPSAAAQSPAAQTSVAGPSQPYATSGLSTQYGGLASRGYGGGSMYGGSPYGGGSYGGGSYGGGMYGGGGSMYGGGGMYGGMNGGMNGGMYGGMNGGGPFGAFGMNGQEDKGLPSGMRNIEQMLVPAAPILSHLRPPERVLAVTVPTPPTRPCPRPPLRHALFHGAEGSRVPPTRADVVRSPDPDARDELRGDAALPRIPSVSGGACARHVHGRLLTLTLTLTLTLALNPDPGPNPNPNPNPNPDQVHGREAVDQHGGPAVFGVRRASQHVKERSCGRH